MIKLKPTISAILPIATFFALNIFTSCNNSPDPEPEVTYEAKEMLTNLSVNVITATYIDLHEKAETLITATNALQTSPTELTLEAAKEAWRATRQPWESSEGFLFGPVETEGIDPSIDSWPVNTVDLNAVLSSPSSLTKEYIDGLEGTLKGFHTIEYLLWGTDGNKPIADFTPREFEYLISVSESLESAIDQLMDSWIESGDNFAANLSNAGEAGSIYPSQKSALQEIINAMVGIADEVGNGKINDPFSELDITLEESRFSANSKTDFQNNIRSIQNMYLGTYILSGKGLSDFIIAQNTDIDNEVKDAIQDAIDAIGAIPGTFTQAIFDNPDAVSNAQNKVRDLQALLESKVKPLIDEL